MLATLGVLALSPKTDLLTCSHVKHSFKESECCSSTSGTVKFLPSEQNYDVIVIGSGIGGSAAAFTFAEGGARVLTVEAGPNVNGGVRDMGNNKHSAMILTQSNSVKTVKTEDKEVVFPDGVRRPIQRLSGYEAVVSRVLGGGGFTNAGLWHHQPPEWVDRLLDRWSGANISKEEWETAETWSTKYMTPFDQDVFYGSSVRDETTVTSRYDDLEQKFNSTSRTLAYEVSPVKVELENRAGFMDRTLDMRHRPMTKYYTTTSSFIYKERDEGVLDEVNSAMQSSFTTLFKHHTKNRWDVRTNSEVDRVVVTNGKANGIQLKDGTIIYAKRVVLSAGAYDDMVILARSDLGNSKWYNTPPRHSRDLERRLDTLGEKLWHPPDWGYLQVPLKDWSTTVPYSMGFSYDGKYMNGQCFAGNKNQAVGLAQVLRYRQGGIRTGSIRPDEPLDASQFFRATTPFIGDGSLSEEVRSGHSISCTPQVRVFENENDYPPGYAHMNKSLPFEFENMKIDFNWENIGTTESTNKMFDEFYDNAQLILESLDETTAFTSIREAYEYVYENPMGRETGLVMKRNIIDAILMKRESDGKYFVVTYSFYGDRSKLITNTYGAQPSQWQDRDAPDRELLKLNGRRDAIDYFKARATPVSGWHLSGTTSGALTSDFEVIPHLAVIDGSIIPQTFVQNSMATIGAVSRVVAQRYLKSFEIVDEQPEYIGYRRIECGVTYTLNGEIPVECELVIPRGYDPDGGIVLVNSMTASSIGWIESPGCYEDPNCYASAGGPDTSIERLARMGMAAVRVHPRSLNLDAPVPIQDGANGESLDLKKAIRFLRKNANKYGFNPEKIYGVGFSFGARALLEIICDSKQQRETEQPNGEVDLRNNPFYDDGRPISSHLNGVIASAPVNADGSTYSAKVCDAVPAVQPDFVVMTGGFLDTIGPPVSVPQMAYSFMTMLPTMPLFAALTHADHGSPYEFFAEVFYDMIVEIPKQNYNMSPKMVYTESGWEMIENNHMQTSQILGLTPETARNVLDFQSTIDWEYYQGEGLMTLNGGVRLLTSGPILGLFPYTDLIGKNYSYTQLIPPGLGYTMPLSKSRFPVLFVYTYDDLKTGYNDDLKDTMLLMTNQELLDANYVRYL